jgi:hypothetical protein
MASKYVNIYDKLEEKQVLIIKYDLKKLYVTF